MSGIAQILGTVQARLVRLEVVVLLSAFILTVLVLNRSVHRGFMGVAYSMSYVVVSYAVGLIQDGPFHDEAFVLWAAALLVIQASAMSTSETKALLLIKSAGGCEQECGHAQRKKLLLQHVLQTGLVLWLIVNARSRNAWYLVAIWVLWALSLLKTAAQIAQITKADQADPSVTLVEDYMRIMALEEHLATATYDPITTMQGYGYIFHGEEIAVQVGRPVGDGMPSVVTIDQVYRWIDEQPYSDVEKDRAKDFCLAFSLFKLLKRRFYGIVPVDAGSDEARDLVLTGLICAGPTGPDLAFRVVEVELAFLYDFFYTRNIVPAVVGTRTYICIAVTVACLTIWSVFFGTLAPTYHRRMIGVHDLDRAITVLIVVITAVLELWQTLASFPTKWRYIEAVYRCVRDGRPWSRRGRGLLFWWKESITPPEPMPIWDQKVGQYVLLKRFHHQPLNLLSWLTVYLVEPRRQGQKRGRRQQLPLEVKRAVLFSLEKSRCHLSNGVAALRKHRLLPRLAWACRFPKLTDQILLWHVVTTTCHWDYSAPRRAGGADASVELHRLTASKLSNYCAYLVAFVPEMLPDPIYNAKQIFDAAVQQSRRHFDGCVTVSAILNRLCEIEEAERVYLQEGGTYERAGSATVIERAAVLWGQLRAAVPADATRWEVLAEFWTEFLLFLAPLDNVDIHGRMLGDSGGEFMTRLWVLLSNAGVLERPPAGSSMESSVA